MHGDLVVATVGPANRLDVARIHAGHGRAAVLALPAVGGVRVEVLAESAADLAMWAMQAAVAAARLVDDHDAALTLVTDADDLQAVICAHAHQVTG